MGGFNIINIGGAELIFIMILAGIFLGPSRIRDVARWVGRLTVQARNISRQFTQQLEAELDADELEDIRGALNDIKSLRKEVDDLRRELVQGPQALIDESNATAASLKKEVADLQKDVDRSVKVEQTNGTSDDNQIGGKTPLPNVVDVEGDPAV